MGRPGGGAPRWPGWWSGLEELGELRPCAAFVVVGLDLPQVGGEADGGAGLAVLLVGAGEEVADRADDEALALGDELAELDELGLVAGVDAEGFTLGGVLLA